MKSQQINLEMLKKLVLALEDLVVSADELRSQADQGSDVKDYVIEMAKASGICLGIVQEAQLLVGDIALLVKQNTSGGFDLDNGSVDKILSLFKPQKGGKTGGGFGGN